MTGEVTVRDNATERRYELLVDGEVAGYILYRLRPNRISLVHTEVDPAFAGRGLGARLVEGALNCVRARGLRVVANCPFVRSYLDAHPEFHDLDIHHRPAAG